MHLRSAAPQALVYPHPTGPPFPVTAPSSQEPPLAPLVYPHASVPSAPLEEVTPAGPDRSAGDKFERLRSMMSPESIGADRSSRGLNSLSSGSVWEQAASLSSREKLKFLKDLIPNQGQQEGQNSSLITGVAAAHKQEKISSQPLLVEPLCSENGSLGKNMQANQDPFETMSSGHPSNGLEQTHLLQPTLTPLKTRQGATPKALNVAVEIEADGPESGSPEKFQEAVRSPLSLVARASHQLQPLPGEKGRIGKTPVTPPVPLPRTLQMMEGAQSGANAVAIEIPESYHGAAHKEEDGTASGGWVFSFL